MNKLLLNLVALSLASFSLSAFAASPINCASAPNRLGGNVSVTISPEANGESTIDLYAQGGMAHFVSHAGPFQATAEREPDGTFYTFTDANNNNEKVTLALVTTNINGKLETVASVNYSIWENATMICK